MKRLILALVVVLAACDTSAVKEQATPKKSSAQLKSAAAKPPEQAKPVPDKSIDTGKSISESADEAEAESVSARERVAQLMEKPIPELIDDLGVVDGGNCTRNTASGILRRRKDEAVPFLAEALSNPNERIRYSSVRCLGQINTEESRNALIKAFSNGMDDVRNHAGYALTWHPHPDAQQVYIGLLGSDDWHYMSYAIHALGDIKSKKAIPFLKKIRDNLEAPKQHLWRFYYASCVALRKIEDKELSQQLQGALALLKKAKHSSDIDKQELSSAVKLIKENFEEALPDVFNIFHWQPKNAFSYIDPNCKTILRDAGELAYPYIRLGLRDKDHILRRRTRDLVKELGLESEFSEDF